MACASFEVDPGRPVACGPGDMAGLAHRADANTPSRLGSAAPSHRSCLRSRKAVPLGNGTTRTLCPLDIPPPRDSRFGSPLVLSRVHWVRPELVAEVKYLTWTEDNLLRQVVYEGLREDKPPKDVRRPIPHLKPAP
jgi:ATP dependent DNA ligase-like protein